MIYNFIHFLLPIINLKFQKKLNQIEQTIKILVEPKI